MSEPALLQTGPETFRVHLPDGRAFDATLAHHTRRGLGLHSVAPVVVATETVRFLLERGALDGQDHVVLGELAGRFPEFAEEMRSRLC